MAQEAVTKPYADYTWYQEEYGGSLITDEGVFKHNAKWASYLIDGMTCGNINSEDKVLDCVRDATCAAAELAYNYYRSSVDVEDGRGKKSESNDGYSVSWDDTLATAESLEAECRSTIELYLRGSGLLFRGVRRHRHHHG